MHIKLYKQQTTKGLVSLRSKAAYLAPTYYTHAKTRFDHDEARILNLICNHNFYDSKICFYSFHRDFYKMAVYMVETKLLRVLSYHDSFKF